MNPWGRTLGCGSAAVRATTRTIPLLTEQGPDGEFPGWKTFHETPGTKTAEVWQLQPDGVLLCKGQPRGYLYTERDSNFTLQFEWRYPRGDQQQRWRAGAHDPASTASGPGASNSSSTRIRLATSGPFAATSSPALQSNSGDDQRLPRHPPPPEAPGGTLRETAGEWDEFEGIVDGGTVIDKVNGAVVNRATVAQGGPCSNPTTAEGK